MSDQSQDAPKIFVDDDWKAEAQREKERLAEQTQQPEEMPDASFSELVNILVMQTMAGFGALAGPGGQRIPPNMEVAKHFIDMLQVLDDKTKGNLNEEEQKLMDQVLYELRMQYVQMTTGGSPGGAPGGADLERPGGL